MASQYHAALLKRSLVSNCLVGRFLKSLAYFKNYPCRCLCFGFLQITYSTPRLLTILQSLQIVFIDDLTFIFHYLLYLKIILPLVLSYGAISTLTLSPGIILTKLLRSFPAGVAKIRLPSSKAILYMVLGNSSRTWPSIVI